MIAPDTGCQAGREGEEAAGQATFCLDFSCARSGVTVLVSGHAQGAVCCSPRSILRGPNLIFRFSHEKLYCYKRRYARTNVQDERAALGISEDAESALRARMPGERVKISLFKM